MGNKAQQTREVPMYVVATALRTTTEAPTWELFRAGEVKPDAANLAACRENFAGRNRKVKVFTERQWENLPIGQRSDDWVVIGDRRIPRFPVSREVAA